MGEATSWDRLRGQVGVHGLMVVGVGLVAAAPVLIAVGRAIGFDWTATVDDGVIATRSFDVLTAHPPLVGQYSLTSQFTGEWTYSLGPLNYWLLAVPAHLGSTALILTTALMNTACVVGAVALANRRGGIVLMFAVGVAIPLMARSLPPEALYDLLNPWVALFPFTFLLFLAWSVGCGDQGLIPLFVLVASFVAQSHFLYLVPVAGVVAIAVGGAALAARKQGQASESGSLLVIGPTAWRRRLLLVAAIVGLLCWSGPVVDQAIHRPGNIVLAARGVTSDRDVQGVSSGWHAVVQALGVPPWWVRDPRNPFLRLIDIAGSPGALRFLSALFVLGSVVLTLILGARRKRIDIAVAAALSLWLCFSLAVVTSSIPPGDLILGLMRYMLSWASPAGMWVWLILLWSAAVLLPPRRIALSLPRRGLAGAGFALVAAASAWAASGSVAKPQQDFRQISDAAERVGREIPNRQSVRIETTPGFMAGDFLPAITYELRRHGSRVMVPPNYARQIGARYRTTPSEAGWTVRILEGAIELRAGERVVVEVPQRGAIALSRGVSP